MQVGIHVPQIGFDGEPMGAARLSRWAAAVAESGIGAVGANDNLLFPNKDLGASRPWLDGPTALAAVTPQLPGRRLLALVLPIHRGPAFAARSLGALHALSDGNLTVAVAAGSSEAAYQLAGIPFEQRWRRLEESVTAMRALWTDGQTHDGDHYPTHGARIRSSSADGHLPPVWIASWGSPAGLRRTARIGDGWLTSAYTTSPEQFAARHAVLTEALEKAGRDPHGFPTGLATTLTYVTDDPARKRAVIEELLAPTLRQPADGLTGRVLVGSAAECAERLGAYAAAGLGTAMLWPVLDVEQQIDRLATEVLPQLRGGAGQ